LSPMAVHYSREARPYALFILASSGVYLAFLRARERDSLPSWLAYAGSLFICALSHLLTAEVLMVLGGFTLIATFAPTAGGGERARGRLGRLSRLGLWSGLGASGALWALERPELSRAFDGTYALGVVAWARDSLLNLGPGPIRPNDPRLAWPLPELLALAFLAL